MMIILEECLIKPIHLTLPPSFLPSFLGLDQIQPTTHAQVRLDRKPNRADALGIDWTKVDHCCIALPLLIHQSPSLSISHNKSNTKLIKSCPNSPFVSSRTLLVDWPLFPFPSFLLSIVLHRKNNPSSWSLSPSPWFDPPVFLHYNHARPHLYQQCAGLCKTAPPILLQYNRVIRVHNLQPWCVLVLPSKHQIDCWDQQSQ